MQATDAESPAQTAQQQLTLTVDPDPSLVITTTSLPAYTLDTGYGQQLTATGGTGAYTWTLASGSTLPPGLVLMSGRLGLGIRDTGCRHRGPTTSPCRRRAGGRRCSSS